MHIVLSAPLLLPLLLSSAADAALQCNPLVFGQPTFDACVNAIIAMPDATYIRDPTPKLKAFRKFVEPQFLVPPFGAVANEYFNVEGNNGEEAEMIQLPKIYRGGKCRVAVMSSPGEGEEASVSGVPVYVQSWLVVQASVLNIARGCINTKNAGGMIALPDRDKTGFMGLYIYEVGTLFEAIVNHYMIHSIPIQAPTRMLQGRDLEDGEEQGGWNGTLSGNDIATLLDGLPAKFL